MGAEAPYSSANLPVTPQTPAPVPDSLPDRLRLATRSHHAAAERSGVMATLLAGRLPQPTYLALLGNLRAVYAALEAALDRHAAQAWLLGFDLTPLRRLPALDADLRDGGAGPVVVLDATRVYVERLQALSDDGDPRLLAHVYTRYLGDLHGGQLMSRLVARCYPGQRCDFYDFGDGGQVLRLRNALRASLAGAPLGAAQCEQVVVEACWSFEQHERLFEALGPGLRQ